MIPRAHIIEWQKNVPWKSNAQVEQDLVIARTLIELFSDDFIAENLAFRGGTALHKLYLQPQPRYSEDIDLVQITAVPFGPIIDNIRDRLKFLGKPHLKQKENNNTLIYHFESEFPPVQSLKLKVETNCREHFSLLDYQKYPFEVQSSWFTGSCMITTYKLEELLGTKLRALYQRKKGRDLYDLYKALKLVPKINTQSLIYCYQEYMKFVVDHQPSKKLFLQNMEGKMQDIEFLGDTKGLLRPDEKYNPVEAYELVRTELIEKI
jgi:predicted nucleotidyltransferase component of viral defense system